jgi:hypothetical protein
MSQFIDEDEVAAGAQRPVHIEFLDDVPLINDRPKWQLREPIEKAFGLFLTVGLDNADRDFDVLLKLLADRQKHRVRFPDPGAGTKENLETAAPLLLQLL